MSYQQSGRPSGRKHPVGVTRDNRDASSPVTRRKVSISSAGFRILPGATIEEALFNTFADGTEEVSIGVFLLHLFATGIRKSDPRLRELITTLRQHCLATHGFREPIEPMKMDKEQFMAAVSPNIVLITRLLRNRLVIPEWERFCGNIRDIYNGVEPNTTGRNAQYIPQLARVDPEQWAVSVCTIDGQRYSLGPTHEPFSIQSVSKVFNYAKALSDHGHDVVHKFIGHEPSGRQFNDMALDYSNKPHNPMINSGAITIASILEVGQRPADRYDRTVKFYKRMAGHEFIGFNNAIFLSERSTADRNFALAYFMRENGVFSEDTELQETLDLYFQLCSVEINCESGAVMAATLANGGTCPITDRPTLKSEYVRNVLSLMLSCGMYDYSGQFAFKIGLPAKSGVSGVVLLVVPNVMGIAMWSPRLDRYGNSVRAVQFCNELVGRFPFHNYDGTIKDKCNKINPVGEPSISKDLQAVTLLFHSQAGDVDAMRRLMLRGIPMDLADYDDRTPLHLAAAEGHMEVVQFLIEEAKVCPAPMDRYKRTPYDEATQARHDDVVELLRVYQENTLNEQNIQPTEGNMRRIQSSANLDDAVQSSASTIFETFGNDGCVHVQNFLQQLQVTGITKRDLRIRQVIRSLQEICRAETGESEPVEELMLQKDEFIRCIIPSLEFINQACQNRFCIPNWQQFCPDVETMYNSCIENRSGTLYEHGSFNSVDEAAQVWSVSVCTVDGQRFTLGNERDQFNIHAGCTVLNYAQALQKLGAERVHEFVGQEPSGRMSNELCLDHNDKPHNPLITSGAATIISLLLQNKKPADCFDELMNFYREMAGHETVGFDNATFLSERAGNDRNFALAYYMREKGVFPDKTKLGETLDCILQLMSVTVNIESAAMMAATLANGGVCPTTQKEVVRNDCIRDVLSVMYSCGMNEYSGQFSFHIGLPAKSGASGLIMLVVPNVMGVAMYSPLLDRHANSVRGVQFCHKFIEKFNFHNYDSLHTDLKIDPRRDMVELKSDAVVNVLFSAAHGDVTAMRKYLMQGVDLNVMDYDSRNALHLAATEGHVDCVQFLLSKGHLDKHVTDRFGNTPIQCARIAGHQNIAQIIDEYERQNAPSTMTASDDTGTLSPSIIADENENQVETESCV